MKRRAITIVIAVMFVCIAAGFLRPDFGEVWGQDDEQKIELIGMDAALLDGDSYVVIGEDVVQLRLRSADPSRCYTLGRTMWKGSQRTLGRYGGDRFYMDTTVGTLYRRENDEWVKLKDTESYGGHQGFYSYGMFYDPGVPQNLITSEESDWILAEIPTLEPGHYCLMFNFIEYFPPDEPKAAVGTNYIDPYSNGVSGEELYEAGFKFTVPECRHSEPVYVAGACAQYGGGSTHIRVDFHQNSDKLMYPQTDSVVLEKVGWFGCELPPKYDENGEEYYGHPPEWDKWDYERMREEWEDGSRTTIAKFFAIEGLDLDAIYRVRVTFTENEDGSGRRCEVKVKLRIN